MCGKGVYDIACCCRQISIVGEPFLNFNCGHLRQFDTDLCRQLVAYPQEVIPTFDMAVNEMFFEKYANTVLEHQIQVSAMFLLCVSVFQLSFNTALKHQIRVSILFLFRVSVFQPLGTVSRNSYDLLLQFSSKTEPLHQSHVPTLTLFYYSYRWKL